jgi:hypothetical protein
MNSLLGEHLGLLGEPRNDFTARAMSLQSRTAFLESRATFLRAAPSSWWTFPRFPRRCRALNGTVRKYLHPTRLILRLNWCFLIEKSATRPVSEAVPVFEPNLGFD